MKIVILLRAVDDMFATLLKKERNVVAQKSPGAVDNAEVGQIIK